MVRQWVYRQTGGMVALSALSVVLTAIVAEELVASPPAQEGRPQLSRSAAPPKQADQITAPFVLPPLESFSAITDRPLFTQSRRPPAIQASTASVGAAASFVLAGIIISHESREVLIIHGKPPIMSHLQQGQAIEGWTVTAIDQDRVILGGGETRYELKLIGKSEAPGATAAPSRTSSP
jgi:hypothetical protein